MSAATEAFSGLIFSQVGPEPFGRFIGNAQALMAADLILPTWIPPGRKRSAWSDDADPRRWWISLDEMDWEDPHRDRGAVRGWQLDKVRPSVFEFSLWPAYFRLFLGGPIDPTAARRAVARHRAMVRARRDDAFQRFLVAGGAR